MVILLNLFHFRPKLRVPHGEDDIPVPLAANRSIAASNRPSLCSWILWLGNLGRAQLGSSSLGSLMKVQLDVDWSCSHLRADRAGGSTSKEGHHVAGRSAPAVGWETWFLSTVDSP